MSDVHDPKPWFRAKDTGAGWTPATWQGWLVTLAFCVLITATLQLVMPQNPRTVAVFPGLATARRDLGVPAAGLGMIGAVVSVRLEIGLFLAVCWWTSRRVRPLD